MQAQSIGLFEALTLTQRDAGMVRAAMESWPADRLDKVGAHPQFGWIAREIVRERMVSVRRSMSGALLSSDDARALVASMRDGMVI